MTDLPNGTTARIHVDWMMTDVEDVTAKAFAEIRQPRTTRIKPKAREHLWRQLAGAVATLEGIRIWLLAGAPE